MIKRFSVIFLLPAKIFLLKLDKKAQIKIYYTFDIASYLHDSQLFKKLNGGIWEFRIRYKSLQIRFLAFWDKRDEHKTLVVLTHGLIKKTDVVPQSEIDKAIAEMKKYLENH